jgi:integrase
MKAQTITSKNGKSANEVQTDSAGLAKTSQAYWLKKVKIPAGRSHYGFQLAYQGRRQFFNLETAEKASAATKAQKIYRDVIGKGWDGALAVHRPEIVKAKKSATVGELIEAATRLSSARAESLDGYGKALRRLAACVLESKKKGKRTPAAVDERRALIDAMPLERLTPAAILAYKNAWLKGASSPEEKASRAVSINSLLRNSKALLSKKVRPFIEQELTLPPVLWFEGIPMEKEESLRYKSRIDAGSILADAQAELETEQLKALLLTLCLGLRRSEADALLWRQFNFEAGTLEIMNTETKTLKSKDSAGELGLDDELKALFMGFHAARKSENVLETPSRSRGPKRKSRAYRCDGTFNALATWLRSKGVPGPRPIHSLRKEIGSVIATQQGIFAASRYLRHSDIRITSKIYADLKKPVSAGLGAFLAPPPSPPPGNVIEGEFKAAQGAANEEGRAVQ